MADTPRIVLLMHPFAGYDRGLLEGIARYAQIFHEALVAANYPAQPARR